MHSLVAPYENVEEENRHLLRLCNNQPHYIQSNQTLNIDCPFEYSFWVSFTEIYNEQIFDLLDPAKPKPGNKRNQLHLRSEPGTGYRYIHDALLVKVKSIEETDALLQFGHQNRQVFSTAMNQGSSRSHSIFTLHVLRCPLGQDQLAAEDAQYTTLSKLSFVDLAGSERYRNTLSTGQRLKEAGNINKSLMVLGQCMELLRYQQMKQDVSKPLTIIPYRQSKLTEIFKASFEGNGKASIIVNINPFDTGFDENSHVMKFAAVTKEVMTLQQVKPVIDFKESQTGLKRSRDDNDIQLDTDRLFMVDVIGQLELVEKRQRQIEDAEAVMRQQIDQQVRNKLFDLSLEEKEKMEDKLEDENTDKEKLDTLKARAKETDTEREDLRDQVSETIIERLQKERKQQKIENSLENESEDESLSTESTPFDSLLCLRKELRKSIFKKDVETKIGKLLKVIASEYFEKDPYNIQNRALRLFKKYAQLGTVNDNKETIQPIHQPSSSLTQASLQETGFDENKDLQEENSKLRRRLRVSVWTLKRY
ncbi:kinesin motor domain-containing protein [Sporodiniella umbellata]|nr:kinesin motor domain-containing protein [Sporodiniella umbellata]